MAVYAIDNLNVKGFHVRGLLYDDETELTGDTIDTVNAGTVQCEAGSVAMQAGFTGIKQLDSSDVWQDA